MQTSSPAPTGCIWWWGEAGQRFTITALFDNLGKGASGAAVQNMNLMLSLPETAGSSS